MTALEVVRAAAGLDEYLASVEAELGRAVERHPGLVAEVGRGALDAGGKRLRPALAFLSSSPEDDPPVAAGAAVELVHMATLVHDDLIDGAAVRRGRAAAWSEHGEQAAKSAGDYLFARAFSVLAETGDPTRGGGPGRRLARARPRRGDAAPSAARSRTRPSTTTSSAAR